MVDRRRLGTPVPTTVPDSSTLTGRLVVTQGRRPTMPGPDLPRRRIVVVIPGRPLCPVTAGTTCVTGVTTRWSPEVVTQRGTPVSGHDRSTRVRPRGEGGPGPQTTTGAGRPGRCATTTVRTPRDRRQGPEVGRPTFSRPCPRLPPPSPHGSLGRAPPTSSTDGRLLSFPPSPQLNPPSWIRLR